MTKKISFLLLILATLFTGCSKDESALEPSNEPVAFVKGQKVTLSASADLKGSLDTRVAGSVGSNITFTWEEGDQLKVTVGGSSAIFTLKSGKGTANGEFEGEMPAGGTTFTAEYGNSTPPEDLLYNGSDKLPLRYNGTDPATNDAMYFKKEGCTIGSTLTLEPQFSVMQFSFYGDDIDVDNVGLYLETNYDPYTYTYHTLHFTSGTKLSTSSTEPTKVNFIVPTGTYVGFEVRCSSDVYYYSATEKASYLSFYKEEGFTLSNTSFRYMPAKFIGLTMTPENLKNIMNETDYDETEGKISAAGFTKGSSYYHISNSYYSGVYSESYVINNTNDQVYSCIVPVSKAKTIAYNLVKAFGDNAPTIKENSYVYSSALPLLDDKTWSGFFNKIGNSYFNDNERAFYEWEKSGSPNQTFKLTIQKRDGLKNLPLVEIIIDLHLTF